MTTKQIPVRLIVAIAAGIVWFLQEASNEDGEIFPGVPLLP